MSRSEKPAKAKKISRTSAMHFTKLAFRSLLFIAAIVVYVALFILDKTDAASITSYKNSMFERAFGYIFSSFLVLVGIIYMVEIILRFFPSNLESMGCQKQFARNYKKAGDGIEPTNVPGWRTALAAGSWIALNAAIGALYYTGLIDDWMLLIISLFYSVCDMICILFFCPFQTWMLKNKCCTTCRIYNWDYPMMFTPLIFLLTKVDPYDPAKGFFPSYFVTSVVPYLVYLSLVVASLALLVRWEVTYRVHPERFSEKTNANLACVNCKEKLCAHKKQLKTMMKKKHRKELQRRQRQQLQSALKQ